jgi:hypothetical protein
MSSKEKRSAQLLQGTLDLIVLRTLATMGPQQFLSPLRSPAELSCLKQVPEPCTALK